MMKSQREVLVSKLKNELKKARNNHDKSFTTKEDFAHLIFSEEGFIFDNFTDEEIQKIIEEKEFLEKIIEIWNEDDRVLDLMQKILRDYFN